MTTYSVDLAGLRHALERRLLSQVGDSYLEARVSSPVRIGEVTLTPSAQLTVRVLNGAADKDDDAVFGRDSHLSFDTQSAWVKYKLLVKHDAKVPIRELSLRRGDELTLADYRLHDALEEAWPAVNADLAAPRTLLRLDDVRALRPGEALAAEVGGTLTASITFSWSDVLSAKLSDVLRGFVVPAALRVRAGAEITAAAKITDQFSLIISRTRDGRFRITVRKTQSRDRSYGVEASLGAEANALAGIEEVVEQLLHSLTAGAEGPVEEKAAAELQKTVRKELRDRLAEAARWKASTAASYEYARLTENTAVVDVILNDEQLLSEHHQLALNGDLARLRTLLRAEPARYELVRYLNDTELTRRSASGFSLGLGKWIDVSAEGESRSRLLTRRSIDGQELLAFRGTRRYEENGIPQNDFEWIVDLKAQMKAFRERPRSADFEYGLHFQVTLERKVLREDDLRRMIDLAAMWGVTATQFDDVEGRQATVRVQLLFDERELAAALSVRAALDAWAEPLAMAMPYSSIFRERRSFASRREVYVDAWRCWLEGEAIPSLRPRIASGLVVLEERRLPGSFAWTAGEGHPHLRRRLDEFVRGLTRLHQMMTNGEDPRLIDAVYEDLQQFWTQRLAVAASGRYLLDRAREAGVHVSRSIEIELDGETVIGA